MAPMALAGVLPFPFVSFDAKSRVACLNACSMPSCIARSLWCVCMVANFFSIASAMSVAKVSLPCVGVSKMPKKWSPTRSAGFALGWRSRSVVLRSVRAAKRSVSVSPWYPCSLVSWLFASGMGLMASFLVSMPVADVPLIYASTICLMAYSLLACRISP